MNREIKFEYGFESVSGIVKKSYYLHEIPNIQQICDVWNVLPFTYVREYTGLKDKNGKEIYEGEVYSIKERQHNYPLKYAVVFSEYNQGFRLRWVGHFKDHSSGFYDLPINPSKYEIFESAGNIYENPELLS